MILFVIVLISCEEIINEENLENDQVTIIAPVNNSQLTAGVIFFDWQPVEGARSYTIQITQPNFNQAEQLLLQQTDSITNTSLNITAGTYQWRVRAENDAFTSPYTTQTFTVQ